MKKYSNFKKFAVVFAAVSMTISLAACGTTTNTAPTPSAAAPAPSATAPTASVTKPEKVVLMMDTAFGSMIKPESWVSFNAKVKEMTGIEIVMIKPDHNQYYEQMNLAFTSGNPPDVMEIGSTHFPTYASNGVLWDMTSTWNNSELKKSGIVTEKYVDGLKIDGKLYGFPMTKGNGTITYIRKDWLDKLGLAVPKTYDEFYNVMKAFTENDPDGDKVNNTYGITSAGLINTETPYGIYLREFYQDAMPDFHLKDGKYVDGMGEPAMAAALQRMKDAYSKGFVDKEIITNKTSTARDKFYAGQVGIFNYWAGNWNVTLESNTKAANPNASVIPIEPIAGVRYIERPPLAMAITSKAKNPEGIFKYLIEFSHDGDKGQLLFTRGIEGEHFMKEADGKYKQTQDPENKDKKFEKTYFAPELSFTTFKDPITFDPRLVSSLALFEKTSDIYPVPRVSEVISTNLPELNTIKQKIIASAVTTDMTVEQAISQYKTESKTYVEAILVDLNKK